MSKPAPRVSHPEEYPVTPDGRYLVVGGKLWRRANPALPEDVRKRLWRPLAAQSNLYAKPRLSRVPRY